MDIKKELTKLLERAIRETKKQEQINVNALKTLIQAEKELDTENNNDTTGVVILPEIEWDKTIQNI